MSNGLDLVYKAPDGGNYLPAAETPGIGASEFGGYAPSPANASAVAAQNAQFLGSSGAASVLGLIGQVANVGATVYGATHTPTPAQALTKQFFTPVASAVQPSQSGTLPQTLGLTGADFSGLIPIIVLVAIIVLLTRK